MWGETEEGATQGSPDATAGFCVGLQPSLVELDRECREGGGIAVAGADDCYAIGPAEVVLPAVGRFREEVWRRCNLQLQLEKSSIFCLEGELPEGAPAGLSPAGEEVDGVFRRGFVCYGVPVGEDVFVDRKLEEVADRIVEDAKKTVEVLVGDRQALWCTLRSSMSARFDYWCQLVRPSLVRPVAAYLDQQLWSVLEAACGFLVPRRGHLRGGGVDCVLTVPGRSLPFAEWVIRQPVKLHGAGLRSAEDCCYPAYLGALEQAAPFMALIPGLEKVMGGSLCWGKDAEEESRWRQLLASDHQDGRELSRTWSFLQGEAKEAGDYLGEEVEGVLARGVEGAGCDSTGTTRQKVQEEREKTRGLLLAKALERYDDQEARPVWSWPERDKHSSAWLLCLPSPDNTFSGAEFTEAVSAFLCLPSPACASLVGQTVTETQKGGRKMVDRWGDVVCNARMRGDGWRVKHDSLKLRLRKLLLWAGIPVVCKVFNLFASSIPQAGLSRIERGRKRQGLVPDYKLQGEQGTGETLCELKCINACVTWYPRNPREDDNSRAVDRRADGLSEVYRVKARDTDQLYCGTPKPQKRKRGEPQPVRQIGPVETQLLTYGRVNGWVFGTWGEVSQEVHGLVLRLAKSRLEILDQQPGRKGPAKSKVARMAALVSWVRRQLSFLAVQQQQRLLLGRLQLLGDGAKEAAGRRDWSVRMEEVARRERQAQAVCQRQGQAIRRSGFGLLQ